MRKYVLEASACSDCIIFFIGGWHCCNLVPRKTSLMVIVICGLFSTFRRVSTIFISVFFNFTILKYIESQAWVIHTYKPTARESGADKTSSLRKALATQWDPYLSKTCIGAEKRAHWLTCLLHKPENLTSDHQNSCEARWGLGAGLQSQHS